MHSFTVHIASQLPLINEFKKHLDRDLFEERFKLVGTIWRIFLLHIINPRCPIFLPARVSRIPFL